ncbi:hypothetical protein BDV09DRAFT_175023 [Aspergillus tetrazonus]
MVCFAVNSTAQPTGRVLRLSSPHQAILRGSPIICACYVLGVLASTVDHILHAPGDKCPLCSWPCFLGASGW